MTSAPIGPEDEPEFDRQHLENSRQLTWDRTSGAPRWSEALDFLLDNLEASEDRQRARRAADKGRLRQTLGALVVGLYTAHLRSPEQWSAYSRREEDYGPGRIYVPPSASTTHVTASADFLVRAGLADHKRGSFNRRRNPFNADDGRGYRSRLRATSKLVGLLQDVHGLTPGSLGYADWASLVRMKAKPAAPREPKRLVRYQPGPETARMEDQLRELNALLSGFTILPPAGAEQATDEADALEGEETASVADRASVRLYRVFNNDRWDHGGRFYGGWWQGMSKEDRAGLTIDGEAVIELDYRALHSRLCYHLQGQPLAPDVDPYAVQGMAGPDGRNVVKRAFNQLLNIGPDGNPRAPQGARKLLPKRRSYRWLVGEIEARHRPIRPWFRGGRGLELQHLDSEIAASVLGYFTAQGVCCLPVHDSFIVPRSKEAMLGQAMCMAYAATLGQRGVSNAYPLIAGWSGGEVEQRVMTAILSAPVRSSPFEGSSVGGGVGGGLLGVE